jgi:hypothetical protein
MDSARKLAQRDIEVARLAREYRKKNGSINEGFYDELARFSESKPLFVQPTEKAAPKRIRFDAQGNQIP